MYTRSDCLVPGPGGTSFCDLVILPPLPGRPAEEIPIWGPDGTPTVIYCSRPPAGECDGVVQTVGLNSKAPDACLLSTAAWDDYWSNDVFRPPPAPHVPFPWEPPLSPPFPPPSCGPTRNQPCTSPSGIDGAGTRSDWCGGLATDIETDRYPCDYNPADLPAGSLSFLSAFMCPKAALMSRPNFFVPGSDPVVASSQAGVLGGAYCNLLGDRNQLGSLPPTVPIEVPAPGSGVFLNAPYTVFARLDDTGALDCEDQRPNTGRAQPFDPGVAQSGQLATVLAGSVLEMERTGGAGPPTSMPVEGDAAVYIGADGSFVLSNFDIHQVGPPVDYTDSSGTYSVEGGILRMADLWAGTYSGAGMSPNVTLTAHAASTVMTFSFNGMPFTIPLEPDVPPAGDFDGIDRVTLRAHYDDPPDQAEFTLTLEMRLLPRPAAVIDSVRFDAECRALPSGLIGSTLTAEGHAPPGTAYWQLTTAGAPTETSDLSATYDSGSTASFEIPLGAPSDPGYNLRFMALTDGQVSSDTRSIPPVVDTTPPSFDAVTIAPECLWPPNHRYALFRLGDELTATASDSCSAEVRVRVADVVSDQADDANGTGDGSTTEDVIFGDTGFCVRSERDGRGGASRHYTVTLEASDQWGNIARREVVVEVPHDQGEHCAEIPPAMDVGDDEAATRCVFADVPPLPPPAPAQPDRVPATASGAPGGGSSGAGCMVAGPPTDRRGFVAVGVFLAALMIVWRRIRRRTSA